MCYNIALLNPSELGPRYHVSLDNMVNESDPVFYRTAFSHPLHPLIVHEKEVQVQYCHWGLIPYWIKTIEDADSIKIKTMNARTETLFEKPSFRHLIDTNRCIIPISGFFEWRLFKGKKYPYYIHSKKNSIMSIAGIWDNWINPETNNQISTFSLITCPANALLSKVHNTKKRMPVILLEEQEMQWLTPHVSRKKIQPLLQPYQGDDLHAYSVSTMISHPTSMKNTKQAIQPVKYPELPEL